MYFGTVNRVRETVVVGWTCLQKILVTASSEEVADDLRESDHPSASREPRERRYDDDLVNDLESVSKYFSILRDHHQMGSFVSVQRSDGSVEYQCPQCPYKTTWRGNIRLHQVTHSDQCPFICPQCFKGFKRNHHLKRHLLQVHSVDLNHTFENVV
ncbi:hypothetical protein HPB52_017908 [Rhipicephalus sanguineus]|uniref:C2H2-type domain-containing protein n=1 Tax=Rhipicephalus sanguineus TaxID=34632 RepID=A0A9D4QF21_RHISA|nr:hypothetical protein HPB52_017908 [Rhipicephalus sanguineus]